jgi:glycine cleavage system H protein
MSKETYPQELRYHKEHDWVRVEGDEAVLGISWFAQNALGEVVYVDLPAAGDAVTAEAPYGELESVKAVSSVFAPVSGEVVEVNSLLEDEPQQVNEDCYGKGWLIRVHLAEPAQVDALMDADAYAAFLDEA